MNFNTWKYQASHGKTPKGFGSWAFCPIQNWNQNNYLDFTKWVHQSTYANAKKEIKKLFPVNTKLVVCP